jgi:hypothetical protein
MNTSSQPGAKPAPPHAPGTVVRAVQLFCASIVLFFAALAVSDRADLMLNVGDTVLNTAAMFAMAHFVVVPLFTSPLWVPQAFLLRKVYAGANWARFALLTYTAVVLYLALRSLDAPLGPAATAFDRYVLSAGRWVPLSIELVALSLLFTPGSNQWFSNGPPR